MDKAEEGRQQLLELLGESGGRSTDDVIRALTYREIGVSPATDLATVIARPDDFRERLLEELALTPAEVQARAEAAPDERHAYCLHSFALYLLALWREPRAFRPIVEYLTADPAAADEQLDLSLTEDVPAILARTYDDSELGPLKTIIETSGAPLFVRGACVRGLHAMVRLGKLDRSAVVTYLEAVAQSLDHEAEQEFIEVSAMDLAAFGDERLWSVIDNWLAEGLIDETFLRRADIEAVYNAPYDEVNEELTRRERFDELIDYLVGWAWFNVSDPRELAPVDVADDDLDDEPEEPYVRGGRKIGRNEPCPCGSGKKYKKCCLTAGSD